MSNKKGFALLFVISSILPLVLVAVSSISLILNELNAATRTHNTIQAYYLAEAGLAKQMMLLKAGSTNTLNESFEFLPSQPGWILTGMTWSGTNPLSLYTITSTGTYNGISKTIQFSAKRISVSGFVSLTNSESVWWPSRGAYYPGYWVTGSYMRGAIRTNGRFNIAGNPVFDGPVTSAGTTINYYSGTTNNPDFRQGLTLGAPAIAIMDDSILNPIEEAAKDDGWRLEGSHDTTITLLANGTMDVISHNKYEDDEVHNEPLPVGGAIYAKNNNVYLSGTLNGQLSIGTNKNIYIVGNVRYASDPTTHSDSDDVLGLVASNDVIVDSTCPYNTYVDAYIVTCNGAFWVATAETVENGELYVLGGMTSKYAGITGLISGTGELLTGYMLIFNYDDRLLTTLNPPHFPTAKDTYGDVYNKVEWIEY